MTVELVDAAEVSADESTPGIHRKTIFRTDNAVVAQSHIDAGTETGWHHHGARDAYGFIL